MIAWVWLIQMDGLVGRNRVGMMYDGGGLLRDGFVWKLAAGFDTCSVRTVAVSERSIQANGIPRHEDLTAGNIISKMVI